MKFLIMNGAGNRFGIIDARNNPEFSLSATQIQALAQKGGPMGKNGADQIIILRPTSANADLFMEIRNADGSEVGACGNAARCVGWLLLEAENKLGKNTIYIQTKAGLLSAMRAANGGIGRTSQISVDMGKPKLKWDEIPLSEYMDTRVIDVKLGPIDNPVLARPGAVSMGNPHCVFFVDDVKNTAVDKIGPMIEFHPLFPQQCNVGFAEIISKKQINLRVWERGVGETLACGTGACASLVAAHRQGKIGRKANISMPGGMLFVEWREDDHVILSGPVELEGEGEI